MEGALSLRGYRENQNEEYSIHEIAEKIVNDSQYKTNLKNGFPQVVGKTKECWYLHEIHRNGIVREGDIIATKTASASGKKIDIKSKYTGIFQKKDFPTEWLDEGSITFGTIYLLEYPFYKKNQLQIEKEVELIQNGTIEAIEINEQANKDKEQREKDKLLKDQKDSIDDIDDLLKDLDKYILDNKLPVIETLQEINNDLKVLYAQKDNLNDIKSIKDFKSHFENAYKEAKKNPELTDIIEQRMLDILRTFYEILGESKDSINTKISEIKTAGNDKKFAVEFDEKLNTLNESITKLQLSFTNEKKLDFVQLETIEKISVDFEKQKKRINQKKLLERSKDSIESIFVEYIKLETKDGSAEKLLKRILKNFYLIFEKSEQQINESFEKIKEKESERKFEIEFTELLNKIGDSITQILNSIETKSSIDFTHFQIIENSLSTLKSKKKEIKNLKMIEDNKSKFESIFDDCRKQNLLSQNSEKSMLEILNKFYDILDFSDEQKRKIQEARQKADEIREFENKVSEQNEAIKSISEKIRELEVIVENNEPVKIELLQTMEDSITQLAKRKDIIHDKAEIENLKVHFDAIFKDCKKKKNFSNSASLRMQEIEKGFNEIIGKKKNFLSVIFGK